MCYYYRGGGCIIVVLLGTLQCCLAIGPGVWGEPDINQREASCVCGWGTRQRTLRLITKHCVAAHHSLCNSTWVTAEAGALPQLDALLGIRHAGSMHSQRGWPQCTLALCWTPECSLLQYGDNRTEGSLAWPHMQSACLKQLYYYCCQHLCPLPRRWHIGIAVEAWTPATPAAPSASPYAAHWRLYAATTMMTSGRWGVAGCWQCRGRSGAVHVGPRDTDLISARPM
jgi:hypothetical protein